MVSDDEGSIRDDLEKERLKCILAFLCVMLGEDAYKILELHPNYIKEKFIRYIQEPREREYEWGMHPTLKETVFDRYCDKWLSQQESNLQPPD